MWFNRVMPKGKNSAENVAKTPLRCDLPPDEALRRAMNVRPPKDWKKALTNNTKAR
jgi:hypothetical protein